METSNSRNLYHQRRLAENCLPILGAVAKNFRGHISVNPTLPAANMNLGYILQMPDRSEKYLEIDIYLVGTYLLDGKVSFQSKADSLTEKLRYALLTNERTSVIS